MTHSLHRQGTRENLSNDFTIYCLPAVGINDKGSAAKRWQFLEIVVRNNAAVMFGECDIGNTAIYSPQEMLEKVKARFSNLPEDGVGDGMSPCACIASKNDLINVLKEAKEADFGLSIMVQGVLEEVSECLRAVGLKPHTMHHSLGVWGKVEKLPCREVLELTTMCGHGMISSVLADHCIQEVHSGKITPELAAKELSRHCICGIFNPVRAATLLAKYIPADRF